ncbi:MAG: hypothetical protein ACOYK6_05330 [Chthoniobacterales bacterium]
MNKKISSTERVPNSSFSIEHPDANPNRVSGHFNNVPVVQQNSSDPTSCFSPVRHDALQQSPTPSHDSKESEIISKEGSPIDHRSSLSDESSVATSPVSTDSPEVITKETRIPTYAEKLQFALETWEGKLQEGKQVLQRAHDLWDEVSAYVKQKPFFHRPPTAEEKFKENDFPRFITATIQECKNISNEIRDAQLDFRNVMIERENSRETMPLEIADKYQNIHGRFQELRGHWTPILRQLSKVNELLRQLEEEGLSDREEVN